MKKSVRLLNVMVSVVFVLLLAAHCYMLEHMQDWHNSLENFWPTIDALLVRPLLGFATGYVLLSSLFSLLHAKLEIEGLKRWNMLRIVMSAISLLALAAVILVLAVTSGLLKLGMPSFWQFIYGVCQAEWLWLILGIYWFLSLNALRYKELRPLDDDDDFDEDDEF